MARKFLSLFDKVQPAWPLSQWITDTVNSNSVVDVTSEGGHIAQPAANAVHIWARSVTVSPGDGVLFRYRRTNTTATRRDRIVLRSSGVIDTASGGSERPTGGMCLIIDNAGLMTIAKIIASTSTTLGTLNKMTGTGWWWVRFEATGTSVRSRAWADGATEPGTWDMNFTDDLAVDGTRLEVIGYKNTESAGDGIFSRLELYGATGSARTISAPMVFHAPDGSRVPYGHGKPAVRTDDCLDATQPAWLTGTTSHNATAYARTISAAGSSSASVTTPAVTASAHSAIKLTADRIRLSADTSVSAAVKLVGAGSTYALTGSVTGLVLSGGGKSVTLTQRWISDGVTSEMIGESLRPHSYSLLLLPSYGNLIAYEGDQIIGWLDVPAVTEALTPTVTVTATTATGRDLTYGGLSVEVETL